MGVGSGWPLHVRCRRKKFMFAISSFWWALVIFGVAIHFFVAGNRRFQT